MAAKRPVWYTCTRRFGDRIKPLACTTIQDYFSDLKKKNVFFFFGRREVLEAIDEFNDLQYLASTVRLLLLVAGAVLACVLLYFFRAFYLFIFIYGILWKLIEAF